MLHFHDINLAVVWFHLGWAHMAHSWPVFSMLSTPQGE